MRTKNINFNVDSDRYGSLVKPAIGITIGDPAGIGPEIVLRYLQNREVYDICRPIVIGSYSVLVREAKNLEIGSTIETIVGSTEFLSPDRISVVNVPIDGVDTTPIGCASEKAGQASYAYVIKAIKLAKAKAIDAIVTAPLTKESLKLAEVGFLDHTEILDAHFDGNPVSLLATRQLKVAHVMRHLSLANSISGLTERKIYNTIRDTSLGLAIAYKLKKVRLIVAGLNPHNGDAGLMGDEEARIIAPAIERARDDGFSVQGPIAADSAFPKAILGEADAVIAMYHDQGHIAIKVNDWRRSYTITVGLEILRTSANHGSALDIAGKQMADETSAL